VRPEDKVTPVRVDPVVHQEERAPQASQVPEVSLAVLVTTVSLAAPDLLAEQEQPVLQVLEDFPATEVTPVHRDRQATRDLVDLQESEDLREVLEGMDLPADQEQLVLLEFEGNVDFQVPLAHPDQQEPQVLPEARVQGDFRDPEVLTERGVHKDSLEYLVAPAAQDHVVLTEAQEAQVDKDQLVGPGRLDPLDHLDLADSQDRKDRQDKLVRQVPLVPQALQVTQDAKGLLELPEGRVPQVLLDPRDQEVSLEKGAHKGSLVDLELLEALEPEGSPAPLVLQGQLVLRV